MNYLSLSLGSYKAQVSEVHDSLVKDRFIERLWRKDPALWKHEAEHQKIIKNALGWLTVTDLMAEQAESLRSFSREIVEAGFTHVALLGMGGSSLAPEVLRTTFGSISGYPEFIVLDSTDPEAVLEVEGRIQLSSTLFIISSKSGTTVEPLSLYKYFYDKVRSCKKSDTAGENFISITDPGSPLERLSKDQGFRRTFLNPPDIGGRFSALSYFGLVPAALMGIDIVRLLNRTDEMVNKCVDPGSHEGNPALYLGVILGVLTNEGRDKITFILSPEIRGFGLWLEQLLAESTGKDGKGIVPLTDEPVGIADDYGEDRAFFHLRYKESLSDVDVLEKIEDLTKAGHPVLTIEMSDPYDLGSEFFRWEVATAVAGAVIGVNPFDQPDVEDAKVRTRLLLSDVVSKGALPPLHAAFVKEHFCLTFGEKTLEKIHSGCEKENSTSAAIRSFFKLIEAGDYLGILLYIDPNNNWLGESIVSFRERLRNSLKVATQFGYGPRYLHSTGQLHKGGANKGVFLIITHVLGRDVTIPGEEYTFGQLEISQAIGDLQALDSKGCRVAMVQLKSPFKEAITEFQKVVEDAAAAVKTKD